MSWLQPLKNLPQRPDDGTLGTRKSCATDADPQPTKLYGRTWAFRFEPPRDYSRVVATFDRKRPGTVFGRSRISIRGVFDEETRMKPLAFAVDAGSYGI
jgi:hypothetical protein